MKKSSQSSQVGSKFPVDPDARRNASRYREWNHFMNLGGICQSKAWWAEIASDLTEWLKSSGANVIGKSYRTMYNTLNSYSNRVRYGSDWDALLCACFRSSVVKKMSKKELSEAKKLILDAAREKIASMAQALLYPATGFEYSRSHLSSFKSPPDTLERFNR